MNYIDIIFIVIIALLTFSGFRSGIIRAIGGIIGIFVGIYVANSFYPGLSAWILSTFSFFHELGANILAFVLLFIVANRIFALLVFMLDKIFSAPILGFLNKLLGGILGFLAGIIFVVIIISVLAYFQIGQDTLVNSRVTPYTDKVLNIIKPFLPQDLRDGSLEDFWQKGKDAIGQYTSVDLSSMNIDELLNYLNKDNILPESTIEKIKSKDFKNNTSFTVDEVQTKFQEYVDNLKNK